MTTEQKTEYLQSLGYSFSRSIDRGVSWMMYCPDYDKIGKIEIVWHRIHGPGCVRQFIAIYCHELVHMYDWIFRYRMGHTDDDVERWNNDYIEIEYRANKVQDFVGKLLFIGS